MWKVLVFHFCLFDLFRRSIFIHFIEFSLKLSNYFSDAWIWLSFIALLISLRERMLQFVSVDGSVSFLGWNSLLFISGAPSFSVVSFWLKDLDFFFLENFFTLVFFFLNSFGFAHAALSFRIDGGLSYWGWFGFVIGWCDQFLVVAIWLKFSILRRIG